MKTKRAQIIMSVPKRVNMATALAASFRVQLKSYGIGCCLIVVYIIKRRIMVPWETAYMMDSFETETWLG
jgi:hypothetical protein